MSIFIRRSVKIGLLVAGFVFLGVGTASARGTSHATVGAPGNEHSRVVVRHHQIVAPQYRIKRGPIGTVVDEVTRSLQELAPRHGMQPMRSAPADLYVVPPRQHPAVTGDE